MFSPHTFVALAVFAAPLLVRADVTPTVPAPGAVYTTGASCPIAWTGDTNSTTLWKNMAIELMAGSNLDMEFITTVTTGQDGTVSGTFSYPCPDVTPNSAIYFYQFVSPQVTNGSWVGTGRFAIASTAGTTTPPPNSTQPDGTDIPWGNGALADASSVVPQPSFAANISMSATIGLNSTTSTVVSSSTVGNATASGTATPAITGSAGTGGGGISITPLSTTASPTAQTTSGAMTTTLFDIRVLGAAAAATLALSFVW